MKRIASIFFLLVILFSCKTKDNMGDVIVETLPVVHVGSSWVELRGKTSGGVGQMLTRGVCFSTSSVFSFKDSPCVSADAGEGEFSARTYELVPVSQYYMKAFAVLKDGTIVYGQEMTFSTTSYQLPTVRADAATDIFSTEATLNGSLEDEGDYPVSGKGFVYTSHPTAVLELGMPDVSSVLATSSSKNFSAGVSGLTLGTTYRVRAYAMTAFGVGYSDEISFTTLNIKPVEFAAVSVIENTFSSLKVSSSITDPQGQTIQSYGFCWSSENSLPQITNSSYKALDADFIMAFESVKPGQVYYVRPYAQTLAAGVNYGVTLRVKVATYDCDGGMIKVTPANPVYLGWLGDYDNTSLPAVYSMACDGEFVVNMSVGKNAVPTPSVAQVAPFCIAKYEVTNDWFCRFLNAYGSSVVKTGTWQGQPLLFDDYTLVRNVSGTWVVDDAYKNYPVVGVSWFGATEFCSFFGGYLPSEVQWEIAARGNVYSNDSSVPMYTYSGSNDLNDIAVWSKTSCDNVGTKAPNQLGLFDMSGNAQEMTSSWYGNYYATYKEAPMSSNKNIVLRGGRAQRGVKSHFQNCSRDAYVVTAPVTYSNFIGFRFACNPDEE